MLWEEYVWGKQTVKQLAKKHQKSIQWIRDRLDEIKVVVKKVEPQPVVIIADATFFGRTCGILVARVPHLKKNIYFKEIHSETKQTYIDLRKSLEQEGFKILAVVIDGRSGTKAVFSDIPVQMCQFHQVKNVTRYITQNPRLEASQELKLAVSFLKDSTQEEFTLLLDDWYQKWEEFLKEKTFNPETGKHQFTHRRLRSALRSLRTNLPYLFTYKNYPCLKIPNTTNSLEGSFTHFKDLLRIHKGLRRDRRFKVIKEILGK